MIDKLHERPLRIMLSNYSKDFRYHKNVKNGVSGVMESMLNRRVNTFKLKNLQEFVTDRKRTTWYGLEAISHQYPQHWLLLPETLEETNSLNQFKRNIRQLGRLKCFLSTLYVICSFLKKASDDLKLRF